MAGRRDWVEAHAEETAAFLAACLKGVRWVRDPANREAAATLLQARMPEIKSGVVDAVMASLLSPQTGLTPDGDLLPDGMAAVLDLRSRYGRGAQALMDVEKYLWLEPYRQARARLG